MKKKYYYQHIPADGVLGSRDSFCIVSAEGVVEYNARTGFLKVVVMGA